MSKKDAGNAVEGSKDSKSDYYLYEDGISYWGMNILRFGSAGVKITDELHKKPVDEKLKWYKEDAEKKAQEAVETQKAEAAKKKG